MARFQAQTAGGGRDRATTAAQTRRLSFVHYLSFVLGVGLLLAPVATARAQDGAFEGPPRARVRNAFQAAREAYNRRDYERAAQFLLVIQGKEAELDPAEQRDLGDLQKQNSIALQDRRNGAAQLMQAEEALNQGRLQDAGALAKALSVNQYLTEPDKQRLGQLNERLVTASARTGPGGTAIKEDAKTLTAAARSALQRGDLDKAEQLGKQAEKVAPWLQLPWNDTPARVLRDVQAARTKRAAEQAAQANPKPPEKQEAGSPLMAPVNAVKNLFTRSPAPNEPARTAAKPDAAVPPSGPPPAALPGGVVVAAAPPPGGNDTVARETQYRPPQENTAPGEDPAVTLMTQAKEALHRNDLAAAQRYAEQAQAMHPDPRWWQVPWWVPSPETVLAEVRRRTPAGTQVADRGAPPARPGADRQPPAPTGDEKQPDARALVHEARAEFKKGNLDEAERLSLRAAAVPGTRWGLFEDSPEKIRVEVQNARLRKDKDEAARLMLEARVAYKKGDLQTARAKAARAKQLHGPYSVWEMGERPDRLLGEIRIADAEQRRKAGDSGAVAQGNGSATKQPAPPAPPSMVSVEAKQRAKALAAEARLLADKGLLVEARQKGMEAQHYAVEAAKGKVFFDPGEDSPDRVNMHLAALCDARIQALMRQAEDTAAGAARDAVALQKAAAALTQARQLAVAFSLDTQRIDQKKDSLRQTQQLAMGQPPPPAPPSFVPSVPPLPGVVPPLPAPGVPGVVPPLPPPSQVAQVAGPPAAPTPDPRREGIELLEKARLELRDGHTYGARKIGEMVFVGPYGLENEAKGFLNSIDIEEDNQRRLAAGRKFDDGYDAFLKHDYNLAKLHFASLKGDESLLSPDRLSRLREISGTKEMLPGQVMPAGGPVAVQTVGVPGRASVTDDRSVAANTGPGARVDPGPEGGMGLADQYKAMEAVRFDMFRKESVNELKRALESMNANDPDTAIDILRAYVQRARGQNLAPERIAALTKAAESRIEEYRKRKAQRAWEEKQRTTGSDMSGEGREKKRLADQQKRDSDIEALLKQYNSLYKEGKYDEALVLAYKMQEIDPDNVAATAAITMGKIRRNLDKVNKISDRKERWFTDSLNDAEDPGVYLDGIHKTLDFDKDITLRNQTLRKGYQNGIHFDNRGERERQIEQRLSQRVSLNFKDMPLKGAIDYLRDTSGINVVEDTSALEEASINLSQQLSMKVEDMSLKSVLNILLKKVRLTYVIKDEALQITTEEHARGKQKLVTYPVADLVVPVENHSAPIVTDFYKVAEMHRFPQANQLYGPPTPFTGNGSLPPGSPVSNPGTGSGYAGGGGGGGQSGPLGPSKPTGGATIEDLLIKLIQNTIEPQSWSEMGGKGTIQYFPLGLAMVINQTQDIQEQVADLLQALRRLQDLEVAIELRLVSVSEAFFEMMRLDFDVNFTNNSARYEPQLVTQQFQPPGFINAFRPNNFFSGLTPAGTFTPDLGVPINNSSFDFAIPPFGGYPGTLGADGGLTLGLAFLSDIQVFMLLEAAQGDRRVNVMQAPKITVFNGQNAFINVQDAQFFLTQINVIPFGSQLVFQPQNAPVFFGINLNVTPVVSADRRFVRLNLNPTLNNLFSATVPLVPIQIPVNDLFQDNIVSTQPRIFQTFFQQPAVGTITLNTTVVIPDGGTVLLGGLKALSEARNEFGPPILSKIPYLNRLFKNVGYGRETESLMILVTARIIINEEEEQIFLGNLPPIPR